MGRKHGGSKRRRPGAALLRGAALLATVLVETPGGALGAPVPKNGAVDGTATPSASEVPAPAIRLVVRGDPLPTADVARALGDELGREVRVGDGPTDATAAGTVTLTYHAAAHELAVTWDATEGGSVTRVVATSNDDASVVREAVLLAGNLARNEAADFSRAPAPPNVAAPNVGPSGATVAPAVPPDDAHPIVVSPVTASLFYPLATNLDRPGQPTHFAFDLVYGRVGGVDGGALGVVNVVSRDHGSGTGSLDGLGVGFLANVATGDVTGLEAAGLVNVTGGRATGAQIALGANSTSGDVEGAELAFGFNRADRLAGLQIGLINVAGDVDGAQIGLIDVARNVRGGTFGLVSVADDIDGAPIAPISVTKNGGVHPEIWSGSSGFANAGVRFSTKSTYTIFFGSYHHVFDHDFAGGGLAIGGRIHLGRGFYADVDVGGTYLVAPQGSLDVEKNRAYHEQLVEPRLRMLFGGRLFEHLGAFAGVAAVGRIRSELDWDRVTGAVGPEILGGIEL